MALLHPGGHEDDPGRKYMLFDIATEDLSPLTEIGAMVALLDNGAKVNLAKGVTSEARLYRSITGACNGSHLTQIL